MIEAAREMDSVSCLHPGNDEAFRASAIGAGEHVIHQLSKWQVAYRLSILQTKVVDYSALSNLLTILSDDHDLLVKSDLRLHWVSRRRDYELRALQARSVFCPSGGNFLKRRKNSEVALRSHIQNPILYMCTQP